MEDEERREKRFLEFDLYFGEWSENKDKNEGRKKEEREKNEYCEFVCYYCW
jgi:hypothetical protein